MKAINIEFTSIRGKDITRKERERIKGKHLYYKKVINNELSMESYSRPISYENHIVMKIIFV